MCFQRTSVGGLNDVYGVLKPATRVDRLKTLTEAVRDEQYLLNKVTMGRCI